MADLLPELMHLRPFLRFARRGPPPPSTLPDAASLSARRTAAGEAPRPRALPASPQAAATATTAGLTSTLPAARPDQLSLTGRAAALRGVGDASGVRGAPMPSTTTAVAAEGSGAAASPASPRLLISGQWADRHAVLLLVAQRNKARAQRAVGGRLGAM
jgi:hypothetical protein